MAQVEFQMNGIITVIQCTENQKMDEICNAYITKAEIKNKEIYFSYDGKVGSQFNKNLTFIEMANSIDKQRKKMNILVLELNADNNDDNKIIKSKNIICPECNENIKMKIENYKIHLFGCKNKHEFKNILFKDFEKTQLINLENIKCDVCKENNKSNTYENKLYKCCKCNINLCPLCKNNHDNAHDISDYDKIKYICLKHNEAFSSYCKTCQENLCILCEEVHSEHENILLRKMILDKKELLIKLQELKNSINMFNNNIDKIIEVLNDIKGNIEKKYEIKENQIIEILNSVKINIEKYYQIQEYLINNYEKNERNYEILYNINEIFNNNVLDDINNINNNDNNLNKFNLIVNIYNQMNQIEQNINMKNEIKLIVRIGKRDVNKDIFFLDNSHGKIYTVGKKDGEEHHHDFLKELNESNVELYINNKKYKYQKYFKPEKEGDYEILLKFNILMKDCSFMFYKCVNIINIDLSLFNAQNVTNVSYMFYDCGRLTNLDLSSFNSQNVTNISRMFQYCSNLININLSSFNTQKVTDMSSLFSSCSKLTNIDLSSFNTQNVINMSWMFDGCSNLTNLDLSSFNTQKVTNMSWMFDGCSKLTNINLSSFNTQNVTSMTLMFKGCANLENIDLSSFNTKNVESMQAMFSDCCKLTAIDLSSFNTQNVNSMDDMFRGCSNLINLDLSPFNTQNVTGMACMFYKCSNLTSINLSSFNTQKVTTWQSMFDSCSKLTTIDLSSFNTQNDVITHCMFENCPNLKEIKMDKTLYEKIEYMLDKNIVKLI